MKNFNSTPILLPIIPYGIEGKLAESKVLFELGSPLMASPILVANDECPLI
jgi:hypothetical protein